MATSLAICKIFEQVYKILLQDVSDFDASQPASFLQEPYVYIVQSCNNFILKRRCISTSYLFRMPTQSAGISDKAK